MHYLIFIYCAVACAFFNIIIAIIIINELSKRGVKINYFWIRVLIPKYVHQYKKMTEQETGRAGNLYYLWVGSINLAWILAVIGIVLKLT